MREFFAQKGKETGFHCPFERIFRPKGKRNGFSMPVGEDFSPKREKKQVFIARWRGYFDKKRKETGFHCSQEQLFTPHGKRNPVSIREKH
ncbi:hypothetical protein J2Y67_002874 [Neobacillus niacini]|nr:hypothetical protein [Neobacillus niacini]